jgi:hypothetical protein
MLREFSDAEKIIGSLRRIAKLVVRPGELPRLF